MHRCMCVYMCTVLLEIFIYIVVNMLCVYSSYFTQPTFPPPGFFFCFSSPPSPLRTVTLKPVFVSCAPGSLISPPHNDSGPHNTFYFLFHTIKACKMAWHLLTNYRDKQGLRMFSHCDILHPAGYWSSLFLCLYL